MSRTNGHVYTRAADVMPRAVERVSRALTESDAVYFQNVAASEYAYARSLLQTCWLHPTRNGWRCDCAARAQRTAAMLARRARLYAGVET